MSEPSTRVRQLSPRALAVTRHLLVHGPESRGSLGKVLSLSDASMSRVAQSLVRDGLVSEALDAQAGVGRPRQILSAVPSARHVVGVKLTGDTAYAVAADLFGEVVGKGQAALPAPDSAGTVPVAATVSVIARLVQRVAAGLPSLDGVGVSVGGVTAERRIVQEGSFLGWRDVDLAGPLSEAVRSSVVVTNDVTALAREQLWFGAGRTHATFGLITVGAGLGFGLVREGHVVEQLMDNGHLLAHSPVDAHGPPCDLDHKGCAAAYLSHASIAARVSEERARPVSYEELVRDPECATSSWHTDAARALGHLVANVAGALQTPRIVLAGEDVDHIVTSPVMVATIAERLRPGPMETQRCELDVSTAPLTFTDWARGAAVVSLQHSLGAR